jgi:hypothetical protein
VPVLEGAAAEESAMIENLLGNERMLARERKLTACEENEENDSLT